MPRFVIEQSTDPIIGFAGLAMIGEMADACKLDHATKHRESPNTAFKDSDILRTMVGLMALGKTSFDQVRQYRDDEHFAACLGIGSVPSAESLRLRLEAMSTDERLANALPDCSRLLWKAAHMLPDTLELGKRTWVRLDGDVTVMDNGQTAKEGVSRAYDGRDGYAPLFFHLGGGWIVSAHLRPGSAHSLHEGTQDLLAQAVGKARRMTGMRVLTVLDAGFDAADTLATLSRPGNDFIVKHNPRSTPQGRWFDLAVAHGREESPRPGKRVWLGSVLREVEGLKAPVRMVFEVVERTSRKGRDLLVPERTACVLWTSLDAPEEVVLDWYRRRGESEQYHAEFKGEMDLERLPSGKFAVNSLFFQLGVLAYNMLRVMGGELVSDRRLGLRKATRRRIRTVIQDVMYRCARVVRHARRLLLRIRGPRAWVDAFERIQMRLA